MVEWSITTVLKTVVLRGTGGSNPSLSAENDVRLLLDVFFCFSYCMFHHFKERVFGRLVN